MKICDADAKVIRNTRRAEQLFKIILQLKEFPRVKPGQFVMLRISEHHAPILRRPFAVLWQEGRIIEIGYKVVGKGTRLLSEKKTGDLLRVLGPLGNPFALRGVDLQRALLVAGGMGIASLVLLAKRLKKHGRLIYGTKTKDELGFLKEIKRTGISIIVATEDGSAGKEGKASETLLTLDLKKYRKIYACGPLPMLKEISEIALANGIDCQVSLETGMACGFGVCLGCVVPLRNSSEGFSYRRVCMDGPVFDSRAIAWERIE